MEKGVKGVVEAEKDRERERVEKQRPAMTTWREGGGNEEREEAKRAREKLRVRVRGARERGWASSPLYSGPDLASCCQVTVGRGISGCC